MHPAPGPGTRGAPSRWHPATSCTQERCSPSLAGAGGDTRGVLRGMRVPGGVPRHGVAGGAGFALGVLGAGCRGGSAVKWGSGRGGGQGERLSGSGGLLGAGGVPEGCISPGTSAAWVGTEETSLLQSYGLQGRNSSLFLSIMMIFKRQKDFKHTFYLKKKPQPNPKYSCKTCFWPPCDFWGQPTCPPRSLGSWCLAAALRSFPTVPFLCGFAVLAVGKRPRDSVTKIFTFQRQSLSSTRGSTGTRARKGLQGQKPTRNGGLGRRQRVCHGGRGEQQGCWGLTEMGASFHPHVLCTFPPG